MGRRIDTVASAYVVAQNYEKNLRKKIKRILPESVMRRLRNAFSVRGLPYFRFYVDLRFIFEGFPTETDPNDLINQYRSAVRLMLKITSPVDGRKLSPAVKGQLLDSVEILRPALARIQRNPQDMQAWRMVANSYGPSIESVARDKGVYLKSFRKGPLRWFEFRPMSSDEELDERLKDTDPETYHTLKESQADFVEIRENIKELIETSGFIFRETPIKAVELKLWLSPPIKSLKALQKGMGKTLFMGTHPESGEQVIFDINGGMKNVQDWIDEHHEKTLTIHKLKGGRKKLTIERLQADGLPHGVVDSLETEIEYTSLTDDKTKNHRLTKIFASKVAPNGRKVIVSGRYKGIYLDDLINDQGRFFEGSSWGFNPKAYRDSAGKWKGKPTQIDPGEREPYVTVSQDEDGKFFMTIPGTHEFSDVRNSFSNSYSPKKRREKGWPGKTLQEMIPEESGLKVERAKRGTGSRKMKIWFTPENFAAIKKAVGSMALSQGAAQKIENYFSGLAHAEQATQAENLKLYEAKNLGGFKSGFRLLQKQKQALAWLEANGDSGVVALDTGIGKCAKYNTFCSTNKGLVQLQDMNPGVNTPDTVVPLEGWSVVVRGETLPIKNFYYGGEKPTIKVTTRYNFELEGSLIHPLLVRTVGGVLEWVKTPDLQEKDYLCIDRGETHFPEQEPDIKWNPPNKYTHKYKDPKRMNPDLARLLGYIIAEGWTSRKEKVWKFDLTQDAGKNPEIREDMERLLLSQFGYEVRTSKNNPHISVDSKYLCHYLDSDDLKIMGRLSKDKIVPPAVLCSTRESMRQFLRGYIDAECNVCNMGIELSSASEELSRTIQIMLLRFGIVSRRHPKKVKGYDHTHWVTHIFGDAARNFVQKIGLVSQRKIEALSLVVEKPSNTNHDIIPHTASIIQDMHEEIMSRWQGDVASFRKSFGSSFHNIMNHIRLGRRDSSYPFLRELLTVAREMGCENTRPYGRISDIIDLNYFFDPIVELEESMAVVMDIEVDHPSHCFVGNGLINHNTATSIAMMQRFIRDEYTDPSAENNGRFLFVSPPNLKGNISAEIYKFLEAEAAANLTGRLDQMDYAEFARSRKRGFWKTRKQTVDPWRAEDYVAIFFDEAQAMRKPTYSATKAALTLNHPRKICLTASPMEAEPMDAYVLTAICNNINLAEKAVRGRRVPPQRKAMRKFKERYCEVVGGRIMGVKKDPTLQRELATWVKRNIYFADKRDVEEYKNTFPKLTSRTKSIVMNSDVETAYRESAAEIENIMKGMVIKYRDKGYIKVKKKKSGERVLVKSPVAEDREIERYTGQRLKGVVKRLVALSNHPEDMIPGVTVNPKIAASQGIISDRMEQFKNTRTILFTDDPKLVIKTAQQVSQKIPGIHIAALKNAIHFFKSGSEMHEYKIKVPFELYKKREVAQMKKNIEMAMHGGGDARVAQKVEVHKLPFKKRTKLYVKFPGRKKGGKNPFTEKSSEWAVWVMRHVVSVDKNIKTATLFGKAYQTGQNLQAFNLVIHLDRNTWSSENMKQRTARAWRQGQKNPVEEITLDTRYGKSLGRFDRTLDQIRRHHQALESDLFNKIIKESQTTTLGEEWFGMEQSVTRSKPINSRAFDMLHSPWLDTEVPRDESPYVYNG